MHQRVDPVDNMHAVYRFSSPGEDMQPDIFLSYWLMTATNAVMQHPPYAVLTIGWRSRDGVAIILAHIACDGTAGVEFSNP